jgi:HAD superfamily hydrolase (TIGR01490 family)
MQLALFDFDGTITTHDSFRDFLIFISGKAGFCWRILGVSHWLIGFVLGLVNNQTAKEQVTRVFLAGLSREKFDEYARAFVKQQLNKIVRPTAMKKILWHLQQKHRVIIVSASFSDYLKFWCEQHQLELISTRLEEIEGCLTGKFATPNCWGPEKVRRIREYLALEDYETVYAYGDSRGDREMLEIANEKGYRVF